MQQSLTGRLLGGRGGKLLTSRGGTIALGAAAAILAAVLLLVYLNRYRESLTSAAEPTPVLVAKKLITKGTSVSIIGSQGLFELNKVAEEHLKVGAVADPDLLRGRVALQDIYPGQQLTTADFSLTTTQAIPTQITGKQRGIAISVDGYHGLVGHVGTGDRVDIYVGLDTPGGAVVKLLKANVFVLAAPGTTGGGIGASGESNFVLRVPAADAPQVAFAADNGTLWLVARPANGAKPTSDVIVTAQTLLAKKKGS